ncbi:Wadjet anti-phage system protein JetD domain-containing protein [Halalkalibacterium ligniniphilum]|uniref:Wadjet anti-phage system protein JetD domain-containing protein n=1 Tax=Halalkalibacterium ligniniphilum TaxID=1134413 RepID=UPI00034CE97C|nr:Wadjet anti-phage system protein JetD domain-containing protein [Halalkalibacterium ligniniphilum]
MKELLTTYPKKTITLTDLEKLLKPYINTYEEFSNTILSLESEEVLVMVKSKGRTVRAPSLALQYRIDKGLLAVDHHREIQRYRNVFHPSINLDDYYRKVPSIWQDDLPYIQKVDEYIKNNSFPAEQAPAPERSFELVGDEKWLAEKGGKELLERIGVFNKLRIIPVSDPLMFAINPINIHKNTQFHLIVENKTTYQGLLPALPETEFSTLIYGKGKSVIKSIEQFSIQYPIDGSHQFFYFGDIDREGLLIWYALTKRQPAKLALPFYRACLKKTSAKGKEYQKESIEAQNSFLSFFLPEEQDKINKQLAEGKYYPQEILQTKELQKIWRESDWKVLI